MNLYVQVLSQVQSSEIVQLLVFPCCLQSYKCEGHATISAGGKLSKRRFESAYEFADKLATSKFNQIEFRYAVKQIAARNFSANVVSVTSLLTPSPTCKVWYESRDWPVSGDSAIRTRKMNAKAAETALSHYKVSKKPSILEVAIEIESLEQSHAILDIFAHWIAKHTPKALEPLAPFGCVDAGGPSLFVKLESNVLMTADIRMLAKLLPSAYPELGQRFDALHPVMFGDKRVCEGLGGTLGKDARIIRSEALRDFAVIRLAPDSDIQAARQRVSDWLLSPALGSTPTNSYHK